MNNSHFGMLAALGQIPGIRVVNKFGQAPSGVQTTLTDIWGRANSTPTQQIWLAPTAARIHAIVSTSDNDAPGDTGAASVRIYGLTSWDTREVSEDVILAGQTPVNTVNSYVIIHRMKVLPSATATSANVGTISATAATDSTITAVILPTDGETEMAIYGVPSPQSLVVTSWGGAVDAALPQAAQIDFHLVVNEAPNINPLVFIRKYDAGAQSNGTSDTSLMVEDTPIYFPGPCIIKIQGISNKSDSDAHARFNGYLIEDGYQLYG